MSSSAARIRQQTAALWAEVLRPPAELDLAAINDALRRGADTENKDVDGNTPLIFAAWRGDTAVVRLLLKAGAKREERNRFGNTALIAAALNGSADAVAELAAAGAALNEKGLFGNTALIAAAHAGHSDAVQRLIDAGAALDEKNTTGETALIAATLNGNAAVVDALIVAGAALDLKGGKGNTALIAAAHAGHDNILRALLEAGAAVEEKNDEGHTALLMAIQKDNPAALRALHAAGADLEQAAAGGGLTPLLCALLQGGHNAAATLIDLGADVNAKRASGYAPVFYALNKPLILMLLAAKGANLEETDKNGDTPLIHAVRNKYAEAAHVLVKAGVALDKKNNDGKTALDCARESGWSETVILLQMAGRKSRKLALPPAAPLPPVQLPPRAGLRLKPTSAPKP